MILPYAVLTHAVPKYGGGTIGPTRAQRKRGMADVAAADCLFDELMPPVETHIAINDGLPLDLLGPGPDVAPHTAARNVLCLCSYLSLSSCTLVPVLHAPVSVLCRTAPDRMELASITSPSTEETLSSSSQAPRMGVCRCIDSW